MPEVAPVATMVLPCIKWIPGFGLKALILKRALAPPKGDARSHAGDEATGAPRVSRAIRRRYDHRERTNPWP
jgi:hypothetical protein